MARDPRRGIPAPGAGKLTEHQAGAQSVSDWRSSQSSSDLWLIINSHRHRPVGHRTRQTWEANLPGSSMTRLV